VHSRVLLVCICQSRTAVKGWDGYWPGWQQKGETSKRSSEPRTCRKLTKLALKLSFAKSKSTNIASSPKQLVYGLIQNRLASGSVSGETGVTATRTLVAGVMPHSDMNARSSFSDCPPLDTRGS